MDNFESPDFSKHPHLYNDDTHKSARGVATAAKLKMQALGPFTQIPLFQSGPRSSRAVNHFIAAAVVPLNPRLLQMRMPPLWCECWQQHQRCALREATLINERLKKKCAIAFHYLPLVNHFTASDYKRGPNAAAVFLLNFYPSKSRKNTQELPSSLSAPFFLPGVHFFFFSQSQGREPFITRSN